MTSLNVISNPQVTAACLTCADRRCAISSLEVASRILAHAVTYLTNQQLATTPLNPLENRDAINILCHAERHVMKSERRTLPRQDTASWLRGANRARALRVEYPPN